MQQEQASKLARSASQGGRNDSGRLGRNDSRGGGFAGGFRGQPQQTADGWTSVGGSGKNNKGELGALRSMVCIIIGSGEYFWCMQF